MMIQIFRINANGDPNAVDELNAFLRSRRVVSVRKGLVRDGENSFWSFCVECLDASPSGAPRGGEGKVDYKNVLSEEEFARFSTLRSVRKELADREAVPVYAVLTNAQLAALARACPVTKSGLLSVEGIGEAKAEKYGEALLSALSHGATP